MSTDIDPTWQTVARFQHGDDALETVRRLAAAGIPAGDLALAPDADLTVGVVVGRLASVLVAAAVALATMFGALLGSVVGVGATQDVTAVLLLTAASGSAGLLTTGALAGVLHRAVARHLWTRTLVRHTCHRVLARPASAECAVLELALMLEPAASDAARR